MIVMTMTSSTRVKAERRRRAVVRGWEAVSSWLGMDWRGESRSPAADAGHRAKDRGDHAVGHDPDDDGDKGEHDVRDDGRQSRDADVEVLVVLRRGLGEGLAELAGLFADGDPVDELLGKDFVFSMDRARLVPSPTSATTCSRSRRMKRFGVPRVTSFRLLRSGTPFATRFAMVWQNWA